MDPPTSTSLPFPELKLKATTDKIYEIADLLEAAGQLEATCDPRANWPVAMANVRPVTRSLMENVEEFHQSHEHYVALIAADSITKASSRKDLYQVEQWRSRVKQALAQLSADEIVFEHLAELWQDEVYHPFLEFHRRHPEHQIWDLNDCLTNVHFAIQELYDTSQETALRTQAIRRKYLAYKKPVQVPQEWPAPQPAAEACLIEDTDDDWSSSTTDAAPEEAVVEVSLKWDGDPSGPTANSAPAVTASFGGAEEHVNRGHTHRRAATVMTTNYMLDDEVGTPRFGSVFRRNKDIPRVFTGSFSELEQSIRKMQMEDADAGHSKDSTIAASRKAARDFAQNLAASFPTSPTLMIQTRGARPVREAEGQIHSERQQGRERAHLFPSDRLRARTLNDTTKGLEAWLNEKPSTNAGMSSASKADL